MGTQLKASQSGGAHFFVDNRLLADICSGRAATWDEHVKTVMEDIIQLLEAWLGRGGLLTCEDTDVVTWVPRELRGEADAAAALGLSRMGGEHDILWGRVLPADLRGCALMLYSDAGKKVVNEEITPIGTAGVMVEVLLNGKWQRLLPAKARSCAGDGHVLWLEACALRLGIQILCGLMQC